MRSHLETLINVQMFGKIALNPFRLALPDPFNKSISILISSIAFAFAAIVLNVEKKKQMIGENQKKKTTWLHSTR